MGIERARINKVGDSYYKLEFVPTSSAHGARATRAMNRALGISGLGIQQFFREVVRELNIDPDVAHALAEHAGTTGIEDFALAVMDGRVMPCADVISAAAEIAGISIGMLYEESSLADEIRGLVREVRLQQARSLIS